MLNDMNVYDFLVVSNVSVQFHTTKVILWSLISVWSTNSVGQFNKRYAFLTAQRIPLWQSQNLSRIMPIHGWAVRGLLTGDGP